MARILQRILQVVIAFALAAGTASAADLALVLGNRSYQNADSIPDAENALTSSGQLRRMGYYTISGRDVTRDQTQRALEVFHDRIDSSDHVVVMLSGHFVHSATDTWFVPVDAGAVTIASINYQGLSLATVLQIIGTKPGEAAVFLGTANRRIAVGPGLTAGIGPLDIPQGVFVAIGAPDDVDVTLRRDFLTQGAGLADALARAPFSIKGYGFISNTATLGGEIPMVDLGLEEEGYWRAVTDLNTIVAYRAYLGAYPAGKFAPEARVQIDAVTNQSQTDRAKEAEDSLNLSRDDRRRIQENLTLLGFDPGGIDGLFGRGTRNAIAAWQRTTQFSDTGYIGPRQVQALENQADRRARELEKEARERQAALEREDRDFWASSGAKANDPKGLRNYLNRYPDGLFADEAHRRLDEIRESNRNRISQIEILLWERAEATKSIEDYQAYLTRFPDGFFAAEAKSRIADIQDRLQRKAEIEAAEKEEASLNMNRLGRLLVEQQLASLGVETGAVDGTFDEDTRRALRRFQRSRGFPVTGYLTRQTLVRLIKEAQRR